LYAVIKIMGLFRKSEFIIARAIARSNPEMTDTYWIASLTLAMTAGCGFQDSLYQAKH
jgi:hypothetical protein